MRTNRMKKLMFIFTAISIFCTSGLKASVGLVSFAISSDNLDNGSIYINPSTGGDFKFAVRLTRNLLPGSGINWEDGTCAVTAVMQIGGTYQDISTPVTISNSDWAEGSYTKGDILATVGPQASYGNVALKIYYYNTAQQGWSTIYSSTIFSVTTTRSQSTLPNTAFNMRYIIPGQADRSVFYSANGNNIVAQNGTYHLDFQADGNLVLYKDGYYVLWAANTSGNPGARLYFGYGGTGLVQIDHIPETWWYPKNSGGSRAIWMLQSDGNFVGYTNYRIETNGSVTITGSVFGSTNTQGGQRSNRYATL